jgi:hypothetical protein
VEKNVHKAERDYKKRLSTSNFDPEVDLNSLVKSPIADLVILEIYNEDQIFEKAIRDIMKVRSNFLNFILTSLGP